MVLQTTPLSSTTRSTSAESIRFDFIDGLRGLAIFLVILRHYYMGTYIVGMPRWFDALGLGYLGVHLFLLLSGFCIAWPYVGPSKRQFAMRDFFARRAARILPAYYVALAIALVLALPMRSQDIFVQIVTHATMTHNFFQSTVLALNGPFWSIALESQLYIIFPIMLWIYHRYGLMPMLAGVFVLQTGFRVLIARNYGTSYSDTTFVLAWSVLGRMFDFALGIWAAALIAHPHHSSQSKKWRLAVLFTTLLLFGCAIVSKRLFGETAPSTDLLWSTGFLGLLLLASQSNTIANRLFSYRPFVWLGVISYSVYLVHNLLLEYITEPIRNMQNSVLVIGLTLPVAFLTIMCCFAFYWFIEKPAVGYVAQRRKLSTTRRDAEPSVISL